MAHQHGLTLIEILLTLILFSGIFLLLAKVQNQLLQQTIGLFYHELAQGQ